MNLKNLLIDGKARLGVWGCGYIGFTTMVNFAKEGVYCIGYDVNKKVVQTIRGGRLHIPNLDFWIGHHIGDLIKEMIAVTVDWHDMMAPDVRVHLVAVPTEMSGEPWYEPLKDVMDKLSQRKPTEAKPDLIMIESTLTPGMFDKVVIGTLEHAGWKVGKEFKVGIAPRRDFFDAPEKNLKVLNRVIGGTTAETSEAMREVLGIVCDHLIVADARTVELVKSVENSIYHLCAVYACQLARAYPNVNVGEVLRLASTHWRIPLYYPSVGTGGYCIPVSSKYIRDGAPQPQHLGLIKETIAFDVKQPVFVADMLTEKAAGGDIGVMGLSYKRDLKVHVLSPALAIIDRLKHNHVNVRVFDPYYTQEEVRVIAGVDTFEYPLDLSQFVGLVIVPPHRIFSQTPKDVLFRYLQKGQVILDNEGIWEKWKNEFENSGIDYHRVGDAGWCLQRQERVGMGKYTLANENF